MLTVKLKGSVLSVTRVLAGNLLLKKVYFVRVNAFPTSIRDKILEIISNQTMLLVDMWRVPLSHYNGMTWLVRCLPSLDMIGQVSSLSTSSCEMMQELVTRATQVECDDSITLLIPSVSSFLYNECTEHALPLLHACHLRNTILPLHNS